MLCFLFVAALLPAFPAAQAELAWQEWVQTEPGQWQRTGKDEDQPLVNFQQLAAGTDVEGLLLKRNPRQASGRSGFGRFAHRRILPASPDHLRSFMPALRPLPRGCFFFSSLP